MLGGELFCSKSGASTLCVIGALLKLAASHSGFGHTCVLKTDDRRSLAFYYASTLESCLPHGRCFLRNVGNVAILKLTRSLRETNKIRRLSC